MNRRGILLSWSRQVTGFLVITVSTSTRPLVFLTANLKRPLQRCNPTRRTDRRSQDRLGTRTYLGFFFTRHGVGMAVEFAGRCFTTWDGGSARHPLTRSRNAPASCHTPISRHRAGKAMPEPTACCFGVDDYSKCQSRHPP